MTESLGVGCEARRDNGLGSLAGTWSELEFQDFQEASRIFEVIDPEVWR